MCFRESLWLAGTDADYLAENGLRRQVHDRSLVVLRAGTTLMPSHRYMKSHDNVAPGICQLALQTEPDGMPCARIFGRPYLHATNWHPHHP